MVFHLVFDGVADGALGVALDVVSTASRLAKAGLTPAPVLRQRVVSIDGRSVRSGAGRVVPVDGALGRRGKGDLVVLPGLGAATERLLEALLHRPDILRGVDALETAAANGATLAASCSATFLLGAAGVLDRREATTTWWLRASFAKRFPQVSLHADRMVVESGRVFTAGAALAHADLMLSILARTASPSLAHLVARYLVLDERVSQSRYLVMEHLRSADPVVRTLEAWINANLGRQLSLQQMAKATGTSKRTLARRTHDALQLTPQQFAQRLRVARAAHLLETTRQSVEEIAGRVGYVDSAAFRRVFRRELGETPRGRRTATSSRSSAAALRSREAQASAQARSRRR